MTNEPQIQETEITETPVNIESVTEVTIDPIYRHKDGRIVTKAQLIKDGIDEDRIKKGIEAKTIVQIGDTEDPMQQFKHRDGRTVSVKELTAEGITADRIASGIARGVIMPIEKKNQIATPPPPLETQQPKPEVSSTGVAAGESVSTTPPPTGAEVPVTTPVVQAPPPPVVEEVKTDFSVTPTEKTTDIVPLEAPLQVQQSGQIVKNADGQDQFALVTNPNAPIPSAEEANNYFEMVSKPWNVNIFDNASEYDKLKNAKKKVVLNDGGDPELGGGAYEAEVDDEEAAKKAKQIKEDGLSKKIDYDAVAAVGKQIDEYYTNPDDNKREKEELSNMFLSGDLNSFNSRAAQITFSNELKKGLQGHFNSEETIRIINDVVGPYSKLFESTITTNPDGTAQVVAPVGNKIPGIQAVYNNLKSQLEFNNIENKEEILDNFRKMASRDFASQAINHPEYVEADPLANSGLDENQILGFNYVSSVAPEELGKYRAALIPDSDIGDNWKAKTAKQQALKALSQIGINIVAPSVNERLKNEIKDYNVEVTALNKNYYYDLTPDEIKERVARLGEKEKTINKLSNLSARLDRDLTNLNDDSKYGYANYYERQGLLQELTEQKHGALVQPLLQLGRATYNTGATLVDLVKRPFLSDKENEVNLATLMGFNIALDNELKVAQRNQMEKVPYVMTPTFQASYDDIMNNKSLSDEDKQNKVYDLIVSDPNGIQADIKGKESNLTLSSLWYGMTNLAADLAPYLLVEAMTGGTATGGVAPTVMKKFTSSFIAAFTTGFHQSYIDAISRGSANPYQDAMRATAISSLAMAGAGTPSIMKNIIGTKSVIGKMVNKMTDKEINAVLKQQPKALLAFKKAYDITGKVAAATAEGFKGGTKMVTLTTAAQIINDQMYGDVKDIGEYVDGAKLEVLKFTLFGGITGGVARGFKEKYGDLTKATLYEAAENPKKFLEALDIKIKNNEVTKEEADQIRNNIEQASKIYKSTYFGFTPQKMDAKEQKEQYDLLIQQGVKPEDATLAVKELVQKKAQEQPLDDAGKRRLLFLKMQEADLEKTLKNDLPEKQTRKLANRLLNIKEQINDIHNGIEDMSDIEVMVSGEVKPGDIIESKKNGVAKVVKVNENKSVLVENLNTGEKFLWRPEDIKTEIIYPQPAVEAQPEPVVESAPAPVAETVIEAKPIPVLGPPKPPATAPEKQTQKQKAPEPDSDIMVGDVIDKGGSYNGKRGVFYLDDQTVVFKEEGTGKEYDLGYINDVKDMPINQFGIKHEESVVSLNEDGTFTIRGKVLRNGYSDPTQAVVKDTEGNVVSVTLDMPNGQKRTFKGNVAEDIAYQIHLKEITKDNATTTEFEEFINEPDTKQQIDNATVPATTETTTVTTNEPVQRETLQPTTAEPATTGTTIEGVEREIIVKRMRPITDKMVEIERQFENQGYEIDTDYDNEITVTDSDGELVEAEDLPKDLRTLAGNYEVLTAKLGEFDESARNIALKESREITEVEAEVVTPEKKQIERVTETQQVSTKRNTIAPKGVKQGGLFPDNFEGVYDATEEYPELTKYNDKNLNTASAADLWNLLQTGHPNYYGFSVSRNAMLEEFRTRGKQIFEELGLPTNGDALYKNNHTNSIEKLSDLLEDDPESEYPMVAQDWNPLFDYNKEIETKQNELAKIEKKLEGLSAKDKNRRRLDYDIKEIKKEIELLKESAEKNTKKTTETQRVFTAAELKENPDILKEDPNHFTIGYPDSFVKMGTNVAGLKGEGFGEAKVGDVVTFSGKEYVVRDIETGKKDPNKARVTLLRVDKDGKILREKDLSKKEQKELMATEEEEPTEIEDGSEIEFKTAEQKTTKGIKIEIPGMEAIDTILVQDGMVYEVYELATGMKLGDTENAMSPAEAVKTIADKMPKGMAEKILQKLYDSEETGRYNIAGEKKGISITNESPAYNAYKQQKIAEAENKPFLHEEKTRNSFLDLAKQAKEEGLEDASNMLTSWADMREGGSRIKQTIESAKKMIENVRKRKDLANRKLQNIPYPEADRVNRDPSEQGLINAIQSGYTRDRWTKLPDEIKNAALEAWRKESAIYNKYGYVPNSLKGEGFFGVMLTLGKYIGAGLSKDPARREARIKEDLQTMKENFKRIDEIYKEEGFDVLKAEEGQTPKPLTLIETTLPAGARAAFDRIKNRQQQETGTPGVKPIAELKVGDKFVFATDTSGREHTVVSNENGQITFTEKGNKEPISASGIQEAGNDLVVLKSDWDKGVRPNEKEVSGGRFKKEVNEQELKDLTDKLSEVNYARVEGDKAQKDDYYSRIAKRYLEGEKSIVEVVDNAIEEAKTNSDNLVEAIEVSRQGGISDSEYEKSIQKANALREEAKKLENERDVESQSKRYELLDEANRIQREARLKIAEFDAVVDTENQMLDVKSKKFNEEKCRQLSTRHQAKYGGKYVEVEVTNQDGTKVLHAVVIHDGYVYEPQSNAIIKTEVFNDFFNTKIGEKPTTEPVNISTSVVNFPTNEIKTNTEEYQGRKTLFSERSAKNVAENFDINKFDPVVIYKHPDGNTYVLSGHSRLEGMKRRGEPTIPARIFEGTPEQAKDFALKSNKLGSLQTDIENAAYYRSQLQSGKSYNAIMAEAKENEQAGSAKKIVSYAYLNPNGKTIAAMESLQGSEGDSASNLSAIASKIGDIRARNEHLTDAHENELFDYMVADKNNIPTDKELQDPNSQINRSIAATRFNAEEPLNLNKFTNKSPERTLWEKEKRDLEEQISSYKKEVNANKTTGWSGLKERAIASLATSKSKEAIDRALEDFNNDKNGIKTQYEKILSQKKAELKGLEDKLAKHLLREKDLIEGERGQQSLFSYKETAPKDFEDYVEGVTDMIKESPEKTLQQIQADAAKYLGDNTPEFKKLIEQAYNEAKNNLTSRIVKTEVLQKLNKGFLKIGTTIFDNEMQLLGKAKELSGSRFNAVENTAGFETRDGKPIGFNYDTDQVARERFDFSKLTKIGEGSDRIVFDLGNGKVLKVAKTARGLEQNIYEGDGYLDFIPNIYERGLNYVVVENINRIKGTDLVKIYDPATGQEIGTVAAAQMFKDLKKFNQVDFDRYNPELQTVLEKYGFADARGYELLYGDFNAARNWGFKDGKAYLIDAGTLGGVRMIEDFKGVKNLSDPDFRKIYYESRDLKKQYADKDKYTKFHYDENGEILGFTHGGQIYLNGQKITAKTTMEEAGHIWINNARETNPSLYNAGLKKVLNSQYLKDVNASEFYKKEALKQGKQGSKAYNDYMQEEALAKAIADEGARFVTDAQRISFKEWVDKMWNSVMQAFGIRDLSPDQVAKLSLQDFAKMAAADVFAEPKAEAPAPEVKPVTETAPPLVTTTPVSETVTTPEADGKITTTTTTQTPTGERITRTESFNTNNPFLYEGTEERQRGLYTHLMDADNVSGETKDFFKKNGITYQAASNAQAEVLATDIIKAVGKRDALQIARGSDVDASIRSAIYARSIDNAYVAEANAKTPQEKMRAAQEWKDLVTEYANQLTAGGQFTSYASHFYRTSPMGFVMKENEDRAARFNEWSKGKEKTLEELWNEINATAEGRSMVNLEVDKIRKAEKEAERKIRDKKIDDFFDQLKVNPKNTYGFVIPLSVLNPVIDGMKIAVKAGDRIADVVKNAIDQISEKVGDNWNKEAFRKDYEQMLTNVVGKQKKLSDEAVQLKNRVTGLEKQIADLKEKIAAGGEPGKKKEVKFSDNPEVQALIEERDQLKKENEDLLKDAKEGKYSDEAKIKAAKQRIVDAIKETQRKIDENDLAVKRKVNPTDAELTAYREEQKRLRKELEDMRKAAQEGKYSPIEMAKAEAKRKQERIDELNRRINENDFSAEKQKMKKQKTALDIELEETRKKYDEAKKQSPEWKEKKSAQFLDRLRKRLQGLSERERNEIVQRSLKQITEAGGLKYDDFRKIVAESMGYRDLTPAEVKEVESLTETINSVDGAEDALVNNPTEANLKALDKARQDAMLAGLKLYNKTHRPADIPRTFGSLITGSLLGVVTLGKNIIQNVVMQTTMRLPKALIIQPTEAAVVWLGNKMAGSKVFSPSTNIFLAQKGSSQGALRGIKRGWFNFYKGTQERDYFGKVSYQSTLAPREAVKDLKMYFSGEKPLTKTELFERSIRATLGWQPDFILRSMGFGDRPFRWAAEGAAAIQIAKLELKLTADNEVNAFMYAPKKYAYKALVEQGVPKEEAMLRAAEIEDRIIDAGSKAVLEQENALSRVSKWMDQGLSTKKDDPLAKRIGFGALSILKTTTFPFVKIPANVYWQMFKVANPEVALLQSIYHGTKSFAEAKKGNKAEAKRDLETMKDNLATAVLGYGAMVAISSLVANGYVRPENDEETKAREREGEKPYEKGNQLNWGRMTGGEDFWIDLSWFGPIGTTMAVQAKIQEQNRRKKLKGEEVSNSWAEGLVDRLSVSQMEALTNLVYDQASRTIGAIKGGAKPLQVWTVNTMNTGMNLFTGATYVQMSKATLPLVPRLKAEGIMEEFKNNQKQRNILYRMYSGMPPSKVSIWGDPIKQDTSFWGVVNNMLGFQETDAHQFGAILYYDAQRTGDTRFFPTPVTDKITVDGVEVKLTQDQKDELAIYVGQARKTMVGSFVYDMAYPYTVPVKGNAGEKLSYNDPKMTDKDKLHTLEMIYELGKRSGFAKFQQMHKEFAPAVLTPDEAAEKMKRETYDFPFKMKLESTLKEKGQAIPIPTKEEELEKEIYELNEQAKKQFEENNPE